MAKLKYRIQYVSGISEELIKSFETEEEGRHDLESKLGNHVKWLSFGDKHVNLDNVLSIEIIENSTQNPGSRVRIG